MQSYPLSEIEIVSGPNGQTITRPKKKDPDSMKIGIPDPNEALASPALGQPAFQFPTHEELEKQVLNSPEFKAQMEAIDKAQKELRDLKLQDAKKFTYTNPYDPKK